MNTFFPRRRRLLVGDVKYSLDGYVNEDNWSHSYCTLFVRIKSDSYPIPARMIVFPTMEGRLKSSGEFGHSCVCGNRTAGYFRNGYSRQREYIDYIDCDEGRVDTLYVFNSAQRDLNGTELIVPLTIVRMD